VNAQGGSPTGWARFLRRGDGRELGAMQALQWAIGYPERIRNSIVVAAAPKLSAQNIAFNRGRRQAITPTGFPRRRLTTGTESCAPGPALLRA